MTATSSTSRAEDDELVALMKAYQAGDAAAFAQLYTRLADDARRFFTRTHRDAGVAHDLVQDLFLEIHRSRRTYSPGLPVRPWVFGIARNVSARSRRASRMHVTLDDEQLLTPQGQTTAADTVDVENALTALPASTREPWLLHHVFGFSFATIAAQLGITTMAAKLRSSRATRALRLVLAGTRTK